MSRRSRAADARAHLRARRPRRRRVAPRPPLARCVFARARALSRRATCARCRRATGRCWCRASISSTVAADALLRRFAFIPYARLDDLMVSYAAPGGGVGPHFDSYDVFLLQGFGRRRWRYGAQTRPDAAPEPAGEDPATFRPSHDAVLAPGDMLYLPPQQSHDGVALDACTTYSIGFRAPAYQELVEGFLDRLRDTLVVPGRYTDRDLKAATPSGTPRSVDDAPPRCTRSPASAGRPATPSASSASSSPSPSRTSRSSLPRGRFQRARFRARAKREGVRLDLRTQLLYDARSLYVNGERIAASPAVRRDLALLADERVLTPARLRAASAQTIDVLHDWYRMDTSNPTPADDNVEGREWRVATLAGQIAALDAAHRARPSAHPAVRHRSFARRLGASRAHRRARQLPAQRNARLEVIVHDTRWIEASAPRFVQLLRQFGHAMTLYRTGSEARTAMDPLLIVDRRHFLHRFHIDRPARRRGRRHAASRQALERALRRDLVDGRTRSCGHRARPLGAGPGRITLRNC